MVGGPLSPALNRLSMLVAGGSRGLMEPFHELRALSPLPLEGRIDGLTRWRACHPSLFEQLVEVERQSRQSEDFIELRDERLALGMEKRARRISNELQSELEDAGFLGATPQHQAAKVRRWRHQWRDELERRDLPVVWREVLTPDPATRRGAGCRSSRLLLGAMGLPARRVLPSLQDFRRECLPLRLSCWPHAEAYPRSAAGCSCRVRASRRPAASQRSTKRAPQRSSD